MVAADHRARLLRHLGALRLQRGCRPGVRVGLTHRRERGGRGSDLRSEIRVAGRSWSMLHMHSPGPSTPGRLRAGAR
jgi:hypothetical protein